jgi:hypothetical protein
VAEALGIELEDLLGQAEVLQAVTAEVPQRRPGRQGVAHERNGGSRENHLAPVGHRRHPGAAVDVEPDRAGGGLGRFADVDAHAHADLLALRPALGGYRTLHLDHCQHTSSR